MFFLIFLVLLLVVVTFHAHAELVTGEFLLETGTVAFLAVGLFACAKDQVFHGGVVAEDLLHVVHVATVLLTNELQYLLALLVDGCFLVVAPPPMLPQVRVFQGNTEGTALANHADLGGSQPAGAVVLLALVLTGAVVPHPVVRLAV